MSERGSRWRKLTAEVRARHDHCGICGQEIDYTIGDRDHPDYREGDHNDPEAFTVDHKKPWKHYPELRTDPGNLQAAHKRCNSSKGDSETAPALGMTSRQW